MSASAVALQRLRPSMSGPSALAALSRYECERDTRLVAIPRPEIQLVVRFGPAAENGLDIHALGVRPQVHRKLIRKGQRSVTAQLRLGVAEAVLGAPASVIAGRIVALADLWGEPATRRLSERLGQASDCVAAGAILERALSERLGSKQSRSERTQLVLLAAGRLTSARVSTVARDLGLSERHLRRLFGETIGVSPKSFVQLTRFQRALRAARQAETLSWANIAVSCGYYDQAHLIAEFRSISGVTPSVLLAELRAEPSFG